MTDIRIKSLSTLDIEDGSTFAHDTVTLDETGKTTAALLADYIEEKKGLTGLGDVATATVPLQTASGYIDSSITETDDEVVFSKSISTTKPGSIKIGSMEISSAANQMAYTNYADDEILYTPLFLYDTSTGSTNPTYAKAASGNTTLWSQLLEDESKTTDFSYIINNENHVLTSGFDLKAGSEITNLNYKIRQDDAAGKVLVEQSFGTLAAGEHSFDSTPPFFSEVGATLYVEISFDSGSVLGSTVDMFGVGDQFVPWVKVYGYSIDETTLVDEDEFDALDTNVLHNDTASEIYAFTEKATVAPDDVALIEDSAASYAKKKISVADIPVYKVIDSANAESLTLDSNGFPILSSDIARFRSKFEVQGSPFLLGLLEKPTTNQTFYLRYYSNFDASVDIVLYADSATLLSTTITAGEKSVEQAFTITSTIWSSITDSFKFRITIDEVEVYNEEVNVAANVNNYLVGNAHGGGYYTGTVTTTCTAADTYYKLAPTAWTSWPEFEVSYDSGNNRFNYTGRGTDLRVTFDCVTGVSNGADITYKIYKNGVAVAGFVNERTFQNSEAIWSTTLSGFISLATDDYLEVYIASDSAGRDVLSYNPQLTIG